LINGFKKTIYWDVNIIDKHGKRFSQTYKGGFGLWKDDFDSMAKKTVLKSLLSKWGILSIEMQSAVKFDQSVIKDVEAGEFEYVDNEESEEKVPVINPLAKKETKKEPKKEVIFDTVITPNEAFDAPTPSQSPAPQSDLFK